jgi:uncharacterized membrane protein (UPF0136 family)
VERRRILYFILGGLAAVLVFGLVFAGVAYFIPRFLASSGDSQFRLIVILVAAALLLRNTIKRLQRKRRTKPPSRMNLTSP